MTICSAACAPADAPRLADAGARLGEARAPDWPELPADCRAQAASGVRPGESAKVALLKTDAALSRQNARTAACADWYDTQAAGAAP